MAGNRKKPKESSATSTKKYEALQAKIFEFCEKNNLHVILSDMMSKAFLSASPSPTMFMVDYLLKLNGTNVEHLALVENAKLRSQVEAYQAEHVNLKTENESLQRRLDALLRQTMRDRQLVNVQQHHTPEKIAPMVTIPLSVTKSFASQECSTRIKRKASADDELSPPLFRNESNQTVPLTSTVEDLNLSVSDSSSDEEATDNKNIPPTSEAFTVRRSLPTIDDDFDMELENGTANEQYLNVTESIVHPPKASTSMMFSYKNTLEAPFLEPSTSFYSEEQLAVPVLTYSVINNLSELVMDTFKDDEASDSEGLAIDEDEPKDQTLETADSLEIEAAVIKLLQHDNESTLTDAEVKKVEDSLKSLFDSREDLTIEEVEKPVTVDNLENLLSAQLQEQAQKIQAEIAFRSIFDDSDEEEPKLETEKSLSLQLKDEIPVKSKDLEEKDENSDELLQVTLSDEESSEDEVAVQPRINLPKRENKALDRKIFDEDNFEPDYDEDF